MEQEIEIFKSGSLAAQDMNCPVESSLWQLLHIEKPATLMVAGLPMRTKNSECTLYLICHYNRE
jgi:hypothetical protein